MRNAKALRGVNATAGEGGRDALDWNTIAVALTSMSTRPKRLPPCGVEHARFTRDCVDRLGVRRPARELHRLAGRESPPTIGELCLALADFAAPAPRAHHKHRRHHPPR